MRVNGDEKVDAIDEALSRPIPPTAPYRGLEPFRFLDRAIFFARTEETSNVLRQVTIYRGVLFFGDSGVGKSSLINAGLIPKALEAGFNPWVIRVQPRPDKEIIIDMIAIEDERHSLSPSLTDEAGACRVELPVAEFSKRIKRASGHRTPLLIFDQFEEFVTLFEAARLKDAQKAQEAVLQLIVGLMRDSTMKVKLLFVFREEYLAKLGKLFALCPNLTDQFVRLTSLQITALPEIISGPFKKFPEAFGPGFSDDLTAELIAAISARSQTDKLNLSEVQVACHQLWRSQDPHALFRVRGVGGLIEDYLASIIGLLTESQRDIAVALLSHLVTSSGTRNIVAGDELIERTSREGHFKKDSVRQSLDALVNDSKIVRRVPRYTTYFYEIISEFLVPWILQQKLARQARAHRRKAARIMALSILFALAVAAFAGLVIKTRTDRVVRENTITDRDNTIRDQVEKIASLEGFLKSKDKGQLILNLYDQVASEKSARESALGEWNKAKGQYDTLNKEYQALASKPVQVAQIPEGDLEKLREYPGLLAQNKALISEKTALSTEKGRLEKRVDELLNPTTKAVVTKPVVTTKDVVSPPKKPDPVSTIEVASVLASTLSKIPDRLASSPVARGAIELNLLDPDKKQIDGAVEISLKHSKLDDKRSDPAVDGNKLVLIENLFVVPGERYKMTIKSRYYKKKDLDIVIESANVRKEIVDLEPNVKATNDIKAPSFNNFHPRLQVALSSWFPEGRRDNEYVKKIERDLVPGRRASLLNLFALLDNVRFSNGKSVFDYLTSIEKLLDKDVLWGTGPALQELQDEVNKSGLFHHGKCTIGVLILQLTFDKTRTGQLQVKADIDLVSHTDADYLEFHTNKHPFIVRQKLLASGIDPGYRLAP